MRKFRAVLNVALFASGFTLSTVGAGLVLISLLTPGDTPQMLADGLEYLIISLLAFKESNRD